MYVLWHSTQTQTAGRLIEELRAVSAAIGGRDDVPFTLMLFSDLINAVSRYSETDYREILDALRSSRITGLLIGNLLDGDDEREDLFRAYRNGRTRSAQRIATRIDALSEVLGSMPTVREVEFRNNCPSFAKLFYHLLRDLRQIESLELCDDFRDPELGAQLYESLYQHPTLRALALRVCSNECTFEPIVRVIQSMPRLDCVFLFEDVDSEHFTPNLSQTQAICQLLNGSSRLEVKIRSYDFSQPESLRALCDGIYSGSINKMTIHNCIPVDSVQVAQAIASSSIKRFQIGGFDTDSTELCFVLGEQLGLAEHSNLEELKLFFHNFGNSKSPNSLALAAAIRGAAKCQNLRRLSIDTSDLGTTELLDDALAFCLKTSTSLEHLEFIHSTQGTLNRALQLPLFFQALRTNSSLKDVTTNCRYMYSLFDALDNNARRQLEVVLRLNREGRSYMSTEPSNMAKALGVLERVHDDLDCLFYHLRENPLIFRTSALASSHHNATIGALHRSKRKDSGNNGNNGNKASGRRTRRKVA